MHCLSPPAPLLLTVSSEEKQTAKSQKVKVSPWRINTAAGGSRRQWRSVWQKDEKRDCGRETQPTERRECTAICIQPRPALPLFLSIWPLILKYWFCHLLYWPLKPESKHRLYANRAWERSRESQMKHLDFYITAIHHTYQKLQPL